MLLGLFSPLLFADVVGEAAYGVRLEFDFGRAGNTHWAVQFARSLPKMADRANAVGLGTDGRIVRKERADSTGECRSTKEVCPPNLFDFEDGRPPPIYVRMVSVLKGEGDPMFTTNMDPRTFETTVFVTSDLLPEQIKYEFELSTGVSQTGNFLIDGEKRKSILTQMPPRPGRAPRVFETHKQPGIIMQTLKETWAEISCKADKNDLIKSVKVSMSKASVYAKGTADEVLGDTVFAQPLEGATVRYRFSLPQPFHRVSKNKPGPHPLLQGECLTAKGKVMKSDIREIKVYYEEHWDPASSTK